MNDVKLLQALIDQEYGGNQAAFARAIDRQPAQVNQYLKGRRQLGVEVKLHIEKSLHRHGWFAIDSGPTPNPPPAPIELEGNPDYPAIRRVQFKLSAGASGFAIDVQNEDDAPIVFRREWFESRGFTPANLFAVQVANGSMQPGLWHGDTVVVNTADTAPKDGEVFAVNFEGELVIKRLVHDEGRWWLRSDNPDQSRYPRKACNERVFIIGRIVHKQSEHL